MGKIINNMEFQHLIENIFLNLKYEDLKKCEMLNNPIFLMKKLIHKWTFRREPNGLV